MITIECYLSVHLDDSWPLILAAHRMSPVLLFYLRSTLHMLALGTTHVSSPVRDASVPVTTVLGSCFCTCDRISSHFSLT